MENGRDNEAITSMTASARDPRRLVVKVGGTGETGRAAGTISVRAARELGLSVGTRWSTELAARFAETLEFETWLQRGMRMSAKRPLARAVLMQKLTDKGVEAAMLDRVVARLHELGLIDDKALGKLIVENELLNQPAGEALLRAKLERKGLAETAINESLGEAAPVTTGAGAVRAAMTLAKAKMASLRSVDKTTARRRLAGVLARRGFDEQTVQEVVEKLLGVEDAGDWN